MIKKFYQKYLKNDGDLKIALLIFLCVMALLSAGRVCLFLLYRDTFSLLSPWEIFKSFLNGLRFDLSIGALFFGPLLIFLNFPIRAKIWRAFWLCLCSALFLTLLVLVCADTIYFPFVERHIGTEIFFVISDFGFFAGYVFSYYKLLLAAVLVLFALLTWGLFKTAGRWNILPCFYPVYSLIKILILAALTLVSVRGLGGKPTGIADVYDCADTPQEAALVLNGAFSAYHIGRKGEVKIPNNYPLEQAIKNLQGLYIAQDEIVPDPAFPLMRVREGKGEPKDINIAVILMESWTPKYIDALGGGSYGVTPNFDEIIKNGVLFKNGYAAGLRSMTGFASVGAALPMLPSLPLLGYGLEMASLSPAFKNFSDAGFYTFFAQTSMRYSMRFCALAHYLGMKEAYGWEDMPMLLAYQQEAPYGYDYDMYMFAADKIKARAERNFFTFLFTGITHEPYTKTLPQFEKYSYEDKEGGYLNTLYFADWSLAQFLERAKKDGWFDNTIFIFIADHHKGGPVGSIKEHYNIPFVIYAPKLLKPAVIDYPVSQLDIVPTLYRLADIRLPYSAAGRDVFDASAPRAPFVTDGANLGIITKEGALLHNGSKILKEEGFPDETDREFAQNTVLSIDKAVETLIKQNKWYKNGK